MLLAVLLSFSTGCTFVGMGIGAAIPKETTYGAEGPAGPALERAAAKERIERGDYVIVNVSPPPVQLTSAPPEEGADIGPPPPPTLPRKMEGEFQSVRQGILTLDSDDYHAQVPLDRIEKARVSRGSRWLEGMFIGLALDAIAGGVAAAVLSQWGGMR